MDSIQCILDRHPFQVPGCDFEPKRKVKVNLLDRRVGEHLLQHRRILYRGW